MHLKSLANIVIIFLYKFSTLMFLRHLEPCILGAILLLIEHD